MYISYYSYWFVTCFLTVPSTPPNAVISSGLSSSAILLQWEPPLLPNGIINRYTLYINYTNNNEISTRSVDDQYTLYLLDGLNVNQEVGVSISSTTGGGEGPRSSYVFSITKGAICKTLTTCIQGKKYPFDIF